MLDRLWAGWRSAYVQSLDQGPRPTSELTLFEAILAAEGDEEHTGIIWRGELASVVLNAYPYGSGHVLVVPNRGVERLGDLGADELNALWATVTKAVSVVEAEYRPGGVNVGLNQGAAAGAGVPDHIHVHVLPRWGGDTNFMTSVAETRVLPESLEETGMRLRARWSALQ